ICRNFITNSWFRRLGITVCSSIWLKNMGTERWSENAGRNTSITRLKLSGICPSAVTACTELTPMDGSKNILRLDAQFNATMDELESCDDHYFITGRAGTGKSTLLRLWKRSSQKKMVVLAPTGSAALQAGGQTIHSFFQFPPRMMQPGDFKKLKNQRLIRSLDAIIIDEISMVRADMIDNIDAVLRLNRGSDEAFGGVQMVFFGDLFQLPPIISDKVEREYLDDHY